MLDTFNRLHDICHSVEVMEVFVMCCMCGSVSTLILVFLHMKQKYRCAFLMDITAFGILIRSFVVMLP
jgi:hypothetical protein